MQSNGRKPKADVGEGAEGAFPLRYTALISYETNGISTCGRSIIANTETPVLRVIPSANLDSNKGHETTYKRTTNTHPKGWAKQTEGATISLGTSLRSVKAGVLQIEQQVERGEAPSTSREASPPRSPLPRRGPTGVLIGGCQSGFATDLSGEMPPTVVCYYSVVKRIPLRVMPRWLRHRLIVNRQRGLLGGAKPHSKWRELRSPQIRKDLLTKAIQIIPFGKYGKELLNRGALRDREGSTKWKGARLKVDPRPRTTCASSMEMPPLPPPKVSGGGGKPSKSPTRPVGDARFAKDSRSFGAYCQIKKSRGSGAGLKEALIYMRLPSIFAFAGAGDAKASPLDFFYLTTFPNKIKTPGRGGCHVLKGQFQRRSSLSEFPWHPLWPSPPWHDPGRQPLRVQNDLRSGGWISKVCAFASRKKRRFLAPRS
ncbi:hypothetical protein RRG08_007224 [Elysia crispata]|uniref:Uncharacterized protein n=1 Tax=Elysia crispata TaxID=231223 RepID=A0AAE0Z4K8_9GAST|nr:hypothetical protein RRG08_007224 [Elysia crispata]